jgi:hypothetical protein
MEPEIVLIFYLLGSVALMIVIFNGVFYGAMYQKVPKRKLKKIIELGNLTRDMTVYDLGAGFGRIMLEAAKSGARTVGYEIDRSKCYWIEQQIRRKMFWNAMIVHDNLLHADLGGCDLAYAYLSPPLMQRLGEKARKEMRVGSRIISVEHKIPSWQPIYADELEKIYMYQKA